VLLAGGILAPSTGAALKSFPACGIRRALEGTGKQDLRIVYNPWRSRISMKYLRERHLQLCADLSASEQMIQRGQ